MLSQRRLLVSRCRSCVGGLLRLERCGAIISMPSFELPIQRIAVVGAIADQILQPGFEGESKQSHETDFVMVRRVRAGREQALTFLSNQFQA